MKHLQPSKLLQYQNQKWVPSLLRFVFWKHRWSWLQHYFLLLRSSMASKRAELGYQTIILIVLAFLLFFIILILIGSSTDFMTGFLPKIFKIGR